MAILIAPGSTLFGNIAFDRAKYTIAPHVFVQCVLLPGLIVGGEGTENKKTSQERFSRKVPWFAIGFFVRALFDLDTEERLGP